VTGRLGELRGRLVVSVQAAPGAPLATPSHLAAMARAAAAGGAAGIRAEGGDNIAAIRAALDLPLIGLRKRQVPGSEVYITPEPDDAREVVRAGADILAVDATLRPRPGGASAADFVAAVLHEFDLPVLADVDGIEAGRAARAAGAHAVATTLSGYTDGRDPPLEPDLKLVATLAAELDCPVLAEGRYGSPELAGAALDAGAFAVVVGSAITDPAAITRGFAAALGRRAAHVAH
jgi:N-acylglucosamine-6-phosphate 2-epimerase